MDAEGNIKIGDFGLAKNAGHNKDRGTSYKNENEADLKDII